MNLQFSSRFWYPLGKLKSLLHSLEEWKAFILFLATSLTCWKSLKLEMASSNGFKCASFSSSLHKLKKSDHHLSILWSPPKSAWEVVTPNSSNFPPYSLYFNDLVLLFFRGYCNFESERALGFWNHGYWYKIIIEKSVMTAISDIQNSSEFCSHSWRILCTSASLVEKLECRALVFLLFNQKSRWLPNSSRADRMLTRKANRMADQNTSARIPTRKAAEDSRCLIHHLFIFHFVLQH